MTENTGARVVPMREQFARLIVGAIAGFAAQKLVEKGIDKLVDNSSQGDNSITE